MERLGSSVAEDSDEWNVWQHELPLTFLHELFARLSLRSQLHLRSTCNRWRSLLKGARPNIVANKIAFKRNFFSISFFDDFDGKRKDWNVDFELRFGSPCEVQVNSRKLLTDVDGCRAMVRCVISFISNAQSVHFGSADCERLFSPWKLSKCAFLPQFCSRLRPSTLHVNCSLSYVPTCSEAQLILPFASTVKALKVIICWDEDDTDSGIFVVKDRKLFLDALQRFDQVKDLTLSRELLREFKPIMPNLVMLTVHLHKQNSLGWSPLCERTVGSITAGLENILNRETLPKSVNILRFECDDKLVIVSAQHLEDVILRFRWRLVSAFNAVNNSVTHYEIQLVVYSFNPELFGSPERSTVFLSEMSGGWALYSELRYRPLSSPFFRHH